MALMRSVSWSSPAVAAGTSDFASQHSSSTVLEDVRVRSDDSTASANVNELTGDIASALEEASC